MTTVSKLKPYRVRFLETLRVCVDVHARYPKEAKLKAIRQWSKHLWEKADKALEDTPCEIMESDRRDFFLVFPGYPQTPTTNESTNQ